MDKKGSITSRNDIAIPIDMSYDPTKSLRCLDDIPKQERFNPILIESSLINNKSKHDL